MCNNSAVRNWLISRQLAYLKSSAVKRQDIKDNGILFRGARNSFKQGLLRVRINWCV